MTDGRGDSLGELRRREIELHHRFVAWRAQLLTGDPRFAAAQALCGDDATGWQAAIYLLTGCDQIWARLGERICAERSIACISTALSDSDGWSPHDVALMRWAEHFVDSTRDPGGLPSGLGEFWFRRWITAAHLHQQIAPALTIIDARRGG